jgi:hypothetical protein
MSHPDDPSRQTDVAPDYAVENGLIPPEISGT